MEVGDDDGRGLQPVELLQGNDVHRPEEGGRVVGEQNAQAIADGDAGRDHQEVGAEALVLRVGELVEGLPGDQHGHDHGLARAGGHLAGLARQAAVEARVLGTDVVEGLRVGHPFGGFGQIDRRLGRLELAEEEAALAILGLPVRQ